MSHILPLSPLCSCTALTLGARNLRERLNVAIYSPVSTWNHAMLRTAVPEVCCKLLTLTQLSWYFQDKMLKFWHKTIRPLNNINPELSLKRVCWRVSANWTWSLEGSYLTKRSRRWGVRLNMLQRILLNNIPELPLHFWIQDIEGLLWMSNTIQLVGFKKLVVWFSVPLENRSKKSDLLLALSFT